MQLTTPRRGARFARRGAKGWLVWRTASSALSRRRSAQHSRPRELAALGIGGAAGFAAERVKLCFTASFAATCVAGFAPDRLIACLAASTVADCVAGFAPDRVMACLAVSPVAAWATGFTPDRVRACLDVSPAAA